MPTPPSEIAAGLQIFRELRGLFYLYKTKVRNRVLTPYRVEKLADDFFSDRIRFGTTVTVSGVLSKYGFVFKPVTYNNCIIYKASSEIIKREIGKTTTKVSFEVRPFPFPAQILPGFETNESKYHVAFIYPNEFSSFNLKYKEEGSNQLNISSCHRGIPILLNDDDYKNYSERKLTLTGTVAQLTEDVMDSIGNNLCRNRESFFYHFLRPYTRQKGFCIDCRDKANSDLNEQSNLITLPGTIYIEGHFEKINFADCKSIIEDSIPNRLLFINVEGDLPNRKCYQVANEVAVVSNSASSAFGFFIETDLVNSLTFEQSLRQLANYYASFAHSTCSNVGSELGIKPEFKADFIFDYQHKDLFDKSGFLVSDEVENIITKTYGLDDLVRETITWLTK